MKAYEVNWNDYIKLSVPQPTNYEKTKYKHIKIAIEIDTDKMYIIKKDKLYYAGNLEDPSDYGIHEFIFDDEPYIGRIYCLINSFENK